MKKIFFILVLLAGSASYSFAQDKINILTTTADLKSVAEFIGADKVKVDSLAMGCQDPHFVEAKPSFMIKAKKADLFVRVGLELEIGYEEPIIDGSRNQKIRIGELGHLDVSEGALLLEVPTTTKIDRSMGDVHPMGNPHYWLDPLNVKIIAFNIAERLGELRPEDEAYFNKNLSDFNHKIDEKLIGWKTKMAPFEGEKIAIYHRSWPYFFNRFGLEIACELEPKPGIPPSPEHLRKIIETIKQQNVKVILMEVFYDEKPARFVAERAGVKVAVVPNSVGGTKEAQDYFSLMDTIIDNLVQGLRP
ncbi:MAG: metal ABC transporter substrate-binding protein [Candidatus Omnitrophota bacterium]